MRALLDVERRCVALSRRFALLAVAGMLVLSLLTIADVGLRYLFNRPITGLTEASELLMAVIIAACFPAGLAARNHVTIDFLARFLGIRTRAVAEAFGGVLILAMMALLAWKFFAYAERLELRNEITLVTGIPVWPFWWLVTGIMALCVAVQAVVATNQALAAAAAVAADRAASVDPAGLSAAASFAATAILYVVMLRPGGGADPVTLAVLGFAAMWLPILLLIPVGPAMVFAGLAGGIALTGFDAAANTLVINSAAFLSSLNLAVLPLFLMMGSFAATAGLSGDIYRLAHALLGRRRGGLAMATIGGCAGFGAVTGSSLATAATIGRVALPEMRARGYSVELATGSVAAGGTLGSLIPPSGMMVIYAVLTETSIGKIFVAAIVPGILAVALYLLAVAFYVRVRPDSAGPAGSADARELMGALVNCWGVILLFGTVIGGIYAGVFTATEAAAVGAGGAFLFAALRGRLGDGQFWRVMGEVAANTAMIYLLLFGAVMFAFFVGVTQLPDALVAHIRALDLAPLVVVAILLLIYLVLGCVMDPITTLFITVPVAAPLVASLGYDLVWWGIITVVVIEIGLITPPIGMNVFVIRGIAGPDVALTTVFRGIVPFLCADLLKLSLLTLFPFIVLWLPNTMR